MKKTIQLLLQAYEYTLIDKCDVLEIYRKNRVLVILDESENKLITFLVNGNRHIRVLKNYKPAQVVEVLADYSTYSNQKV